MEKVRLYEQQKIHSLLEKEKEDNQLRRENKVNLGIIFN